jgi:GT2 family glycosyltransferase
MQPAASATSSRATCTLVVVTFNSASHLPRFLESVPVALRDGHARVIVVDNGSTDGTVPLARAHPSVDLVEVGTNRGYAGGINVGRRHAAPRLPLVVANPDLRFHDGALDRMLEAVLAPGVGAVACRLVDDRGNTLPSLCREPTILRAIGDSLLGSSVKRRPAWSTEFIDDPRHYERDVDIDWATGAAWVVNPACDAQVGAWDESYFMFSEEVDYARRIRDAGYRVRYVADAVATHDEGGSGRNDDLRALLELNRVRYYRRHHNRVASAAFRIAVGLRGALRCWSRRDRRAALVALGASDPPQFSGADPIGAVLW